MGVVMFAIFGATVGGALQQRPATSSRAQRSSRLRLSVEEPGSVARRTVLQLGALAALPLPARADLFGDLGVNPKDLGLKEQPPPLPLDPKERKAAEEKAAAEARAAKKAEEEKKRAEAAAETKRVKDEKAAAEARVKEEAEKEKANKKELEKLGLSPDVLGLDGKAPKRTKPLTDKEKKQQKKKNEEAKKRKSEKKGKARKEEEAAKRDADKARKDLEKTKGLFDKYQSELRQKTQEFERKDATYKSAQKKLQSI